MDFVPRSGRLRSLVGPGDRQAEQTPALDEISGRPTAELTPEGLPVFGVDGSLDQRSLASLYHLSCSRDKTEVFDHYEQALKWLMRAEFV